MACNLPFPSQSFITERTSTPTAIEILTTGSLETPSSGIKTHSDDRLNITFDYPSDWYLQESPEETVDVLLTSYDPGSPPHKLEWDSTTVMIGIRGIPPELASDSLETWIEATKQEATETQLDIFSEERLTIGKGFPAARITLVSGSGGILDYVRVILDGRHFEIIVQGNFALAKTVLDTLRLNK